MKKITLLLLCVLLLSGCSSLALDNQPSVKPQQKDTEYVTVEDAKNTALLHQNVNVNDATFLKSELSTYENKTVYTICFTTGEATYNYYIDAKANTVVAFDIKTPNANGNSNTNTPTTITLEQAKEIALNHSGVNASEVTFVQAELDGRYVYEIEFYVGNVEYDYKIRSTTGEIISCDNDAEHYHHNNSKGNSNSNQVKPSYNISEAKAKEIALNHAGVSESQISHFKIKLDYDDGRVEYEIEFHVGHTEYEYEIDANSGNINSFDVDHD